MKMLILLFLLPLLAFSQEEVELAVRTESGWELNYDFPSIANQLFSDSSIIVVDSAYFDTITSTIQLKCHTTDLNQITIDRIAGSIKSGKFYSMFDGYPNNWYVQCLHDFCCACKKNIQGKCVCYLDYCGGGMKCETRTYGHDIPIGGLSNAIRAYLN